MDSSGSNNPAEGHDLGHIDAQYQQDLEDADETLPTVELEDEEVVMTGGAGVGYGQDEAGNLLNAAAAASDASDASFQGVYDAPDEQKEDQNAESEEEANITDALAVNDEPWQHKEPKAQPLKYHVATDGQGGTKLMTITKKINFNSRKEVKAANKIRDQNIRRSQQTPKKRESKAGRHFTPVHEAWAIQEHHNWANTVGGRMPMHNFAPAFNARFPTEHRTVSALTGFIRRSVALKAVRDSYK